MINNKNIIWKSAIPTYILILFIGFSFLHSISQPISFITETIYLFQPFDSKGLIKGGIYAAIYSGAIITIILTIFIRNKLLATLIIAFICISYGIDLFIQLIGSNEQGLSLGLLTLALIEQSRANDVLIFKTQILQATAIAVLLLISIIVSRLVFFKHFRMNTLLCIVSVVIIVLLSYGAVTKIFSIVGQSFPAPIKAMSLGLEYYLDDKQDVPRILADDIKVNRKADYKTIVWVIDESVGGQYLSVNGYSKNTTPYLLTLSKENNADIFNYGVVPSISNCSGSANLFLRIGLTNSFPLESYKELKQTLPTIFQYAKRAGFKTTLIDAQIAKGQLQNFLSVSDKLDIDDFVTFNRNVIPKQRDPETAILLNKILDKDDEQSRFIVIVKWGSHWPYPQNYKNETFKPSAKKSFVEMTESNKELIFNAYYNSLKWSVDDFLKSVTKNRELKNQIIFYTSDHGQSLYQNDDPLTHCHDSARTPPPVDEYKVPLMVFSHDIKSKISLLKENVVAQEQLFATTLEIMGYPEKTVKRYGPTFAEGMPADKIKVNVGNTNKRVEYKP